jgi:hypothetical protein
MSISPTRFKPILNVDDTANNAPFFPHSSGISVPHSSGLSVPHSSGLSAPQIMTSFNHIRNRKIIKNDEIKVGETFKPKKHFLQPETNSFKGDDFLFVSSSGQNDVSPTFSTSSKTRKLLEEVLRNQNELYKKLGKISSPTAKKQEEEEVSVDLEKLPEEEKRKKRLELIDELIKYNSNNSNFQIPYDNCSLNYLNEITSRYRKKHNKEKGKWYIEIGLQLLFFGTEKFLLKMNIKADGFCDFHTKRLNRYETLINELTEVYFSEETGELKLSPGQRFILFIFSQFFLFVAYKFFGENPIFKNILNFFDTTISNTLTNNNNGGTGDVGAGGSIGEGKGTESIVNNNTGFFNNIMTGLFNSSSTNSSGNGANGSTLKSTPVMRQPSSSSPVVSPSSPKRDSPSKRKKEG